ncbi:Aryl-phospho-beta-D-glucosidase BglC, GH1 family [Vibrio xiamenensis]|uniref:Aryl-phospho-beta-D-glucosidase BglC, GH1 family n=1 Tax=Vibrio xiamenensis TaxID=861298 RepID=A0A1G8CGW4_9VIBR|nr:glycoside hydrolase family 5 protein [Vibrio xiamenensis]SDH44140.1 Aryl-phospho-beta-D-glucosidase BglC, GH1 family [Vibrio xiamenensis]
MKLKNIEPNKINIRADDLTPAQIRNSAMGQGINLDHPSDNVIDDHYFNIIKEAGFSNVRLAIEWQSYWNGSDFGKLETTAIDIVKDAINSGLYVIVDLHHFIGDVETFITIWSAIQTLFVDYPDVMFEPLNEPRPYDEFTDGQSWAYYLEAFYSLIRDREAERIIIAGTLNWNQASGLDDLPDIVNNDEYTIVSLHQYAPQTFTHQGTDSQYDNTLGSTWSATETQRGVVDGVIDEIKEYIELYPNMPINIGEFGVYHKVHDGFEPYNATPEYSRRRWVEYNALCFKNNNFSSCYWEFEKGFGIYNPNAGVLDEVMVDAILYPQEIPLVPTITTNIDEVDYAIINSKYSVSLTAENADEFQLQQYDSETGSWNTLTNYNQTITENEDGTVTVRFQTSSIASSSWASPSAFRILATNSETGETIESNVMVRKVVSEIPAPSVVNDLPETSTVELGRKYSLSASFSDAVSARIFSVKDDTSTDSTKSYKFTEYTIDGIYYVEFESYNEAEESWSSPLTFYIEATGYDGTTVQTSPTVRTVVGVEEALMV